MKIIYHCYGGTHSSVTAAAIHLGWLPLHGLPPAERLLEIPHFDTRRERDHGLITFMGHDERNNEVFIVGRSNKPRALISLTGELAVAFGIPFDSFRLINVSPGINLMMRAGGVLSRRLSLISPGRPLVTRGTLKALPRIQGIVDGIKKELGAK